MADMSGERKYNGKQKATDAGMPNKGFGDGAAKFGKKNFSGPKSSMSGMGVTPHASGSPWKYGRQDQQEKDYAKDYSRRGSQAGGSGATGPKHPSAAIPDSIYGGKSADRGKQKRDSN